MLRGTDEGREGALLRRLKDTGHGGRPAAFGFVTGAEGAPRRRAIAVVARLAAGPALAGDVQALVEAGADGIEVAVQPGGNVGAVVAAVAEAVKVPCGIYVSGAARATAIEGIAGLDWIHLAAAAPASLLGGKGPTRLVSLSPNMPPGRLPGLAGLKADVVVVDGAGTAGTATTSGASAETALTVEMLLALRTIQAAAQGPVLVASSLGIAPSDVEVLHDHGIEGVLLTGDATTVRAFIAAIDKL